MTSGLEPGLLSQPNKIEAAEREFSKDVKAGLSAYPKKLSSKYLYDKTGDALFNRLCSFLNTISPNQNWTSFRTKSLILPALLGKAAST